MAENAEFPPCWANDRCYFHGRPRPSPQPKATCAVPLCKAPTLRRFHRLDQIILTHPTELHALGVDAEISVETRYSSCRTAWPAGLLTGARGQPTHLRHPRSRREQL